MTPASRRAALAAAAVACAALAIYVATLAPSLGFIDAGELATVTATFGIAHPTGYPLFTMLGGLWAHIPAGTVIWRMNLFSAVLCATADGVFTYAAWLLLGLVDTRKAAPKRKTGGRGKTAAPAPASRKPIALPEDLRLVAAVFGGCAIAFSETMWSTALEVEVYPLHLLLVSCTLLAFVRAAYLGAPTPRIEARRWALFALALGLAFSNHMSSVMLVPGYAIAYVRRRGWNAAALRTALRTAPFFATGLLPYLYLPLRAAAGPALNWGNPSTLERLLWHVSGKQYRVWMFSGVEQAKKQFLYFAGAFPAEFGYLISALAVLGFFVAFARHRASGWLLTLLFLTCLFWAINYDIHDIDSYFLLAYAVSGIWAAYALAWIGTRPFARGNVFTAAAIAALCAGVAIGLCWGRVSERGDRLVEDYTANMFSSLKPNALVLSYQWDFWVSASYYEQYVLGKRPDIVVIDKELLRRSWYFDQLARNHPEVYARSKPEIDAFLAELGKFEHDIPYAPDVIENAYRAVINSFVERNYASRPVYFTVEMERDLAPGYVRVPEGLAFRLYRPGDVPTPDAPVWDDFVYRPFDRRGRLEDALRGFYGTMLASRGGWLFQQRRTDAASRYVERALKIDATNATALEWRRRIDTASRIGALAPR